MVKWPFNDTCSCPNGQQASKQARVTNEAIGGPLESSVGQSVLRSLFRLTDCVRIRFAHQLSSQNVRTRSSRTSERTRSKHASRASAGSRSRGRGTKSTPHLMKSVVIVVDVDLEVSSVSVRVRAAKA